MSDEDQHIGSAARIGAGQPAGQPAERPGPHADERAASSGLPARADGFSSEWLRLWAESTTDYSIFALSPAGSIINWNRGGVAIQGYQSDEIIGQHVRVLYTSEDQHDGLPGVGLRRACEDGRYEVEGWRVRKDGSLFWANEIVTPLQAPDGELLGFGLVVRDISDKKKAADAALESDRRFRLLVQGVNDYAIFMLSPEGYVTNWNPGARRIKGYTDEQIIGSHFSCFYTPEDAAAGVPQRGLETAAREGRWEAEGWRVRRDGSRFWAHVVIDAIRDESGTLIGFAKITRDITERRQAAELLDQTRNALFQSQKMEALGKLTGGVAHDFNNVLQVLRGNLELLGARHDDSWTHSRIGRAIEAVERGSKLASQLLAFGRRQTLQPVVNNLGVVLHSMEDMLRRALGERVNVRVLEAHGGELWNVLVDRHQLENVILNLAINSRDAMPEGGMVTFGLSNAVIDAHAAVAAQIKPGEYVKMTVTDTGIGMSADAVERAFDPFFTTKPEGQGTGLGLSMAYGFVLQSGGHIELASTPGVGTTVTIYLPRSTGALVERHTAQAGHDPAEGLGGSETVLVVEDDRRVQLTVVDMLSQLGYAVLTANDATEALTVLRSGARVDLLFSDVVMPGPLLSPEMARQALLIRPSLKVLFTSGHTRDTIGLDAQLRGGTDLLQKPYSRIQLARKVREVFDGTSRAGVGNTPSPDMSPTLAILVVEDDRDARDALCELLGLLGHTYEATGNAEEALQRLQRHPFDVLLTDLTLPGMSGIDLARAATGMHAVRRVVFSSGHEAPLTGASLPFAWKALQKPYSFDQLQDALDA